MSCGIGPHGRLRPIFVWLMYGRLFSRDTVVVMLSGWLNVPTCCVIKMQLHIYGQKMIWPFYFRENYRRKLWTRGETSDTSQLLYFLAISIIQMNNHPVWGYDKISSVMFIRRLQKEINVICSKLPELQKLHSFAGHELGWIMLT